MVPLGPKFVRITSCRPFAALMFMNSAAVRPMTSAFEFSDFTAMAAVYQARTLLCRSSSGRDQASQQLSSGDVQTMVAACPDKLRYEVPQARAIFFSYLTPRTVQPRSSKSRSYDVKLLPSQGRRPVRAEGGAR